MAPQSVVSMVETHPIHAMLCTIEHALDSAPIEAWAGLEASAAREWVQRVSRLKARLDAHQLAGAQRLDETGVAKKFGATSTGDLIARDFGGNRTESDRLVKTAKTLQEASATREALSRGGLSAGQASIIGDALTRLPASVTPAQREAAEAGMIADATRLSTKDLWRKAKRLPEAFADRREADAFENDQLRSQEERARVKTGLRMWDNRDGTYSGDFTLPEAQADMLKTALDAIAAPRRAHLDHDDPTFDTDPYHRMGVAFGDLVEHLPTDELPSGSGIGATVVVTLDHETLVQGIKPASLSTGTRISASEARRIACTARLVPQVLGGTSLPLDLGRSQRLFTKAQRLAMAHRDGGCSFPGCDRPPTWCEAHHHGGAWSEGGRTDVADGSLFCSVHHHKIHEPGWRVRTHPDTGRTEIRRPGARIWETNHRWRPDLPTRLSP